MIFPKLARTEKWDDILKDESQVIFLEGPSQTSKTTLVSSKAVWDIFKFSKYGETIIYLCGSDTNTIYRNFVEKDTSITNQFPFISKYVGDNQRGGERIEVIVPYEIDGRTVYEAKKIYFVGYSTINSENKLLGGKPFMIVADEINKAHSSFIKQIFTRVNATGCRLLATSNGDMPDNDCYNYLNSCRPTSKYRADVPESTMQYMDATMLKKGWTYYYVGLKDRPIAPDGITMDEWISNMMTSHPVGSFSYNAYVLGIRGFVEGAIYAKYMSADKNLISWTDVYNNPQTQYPFIRYTIGIDVGFTDFTVVTLVGFTSRYKEAIVLDYMEINHSGIDEIWNALDQFIKPYAQVIGHRIYGVFIDSAAQILKASLAPRLLNYYGLQIVDSYKYTIKERVDWGIRFIHQGRLKFTDRARGIYASFSKALYSSNTKATDVREYSDHIDKDRIDATEYAITPFIREMLEFY